MKIRSFTSAFAATACLALLASPAIAKPGKDKDKGKGGAPSHVGKDKDKGDDLIDLGKGKGKGGAPGNADKDHKGHKGHKGNDKFDDNEIGIFGNFFAPENRKNLPPGLRKNLERGKPLPPGWQKKVAAGQVIDAGWLNLMTPVSYDYFPNIRRAPGTRLYYHDNRLVRVNEETRVILDVINLLTR